MATFYVFPERGCLIVLKVNYIVFLILYLHSKVKNRDDAFD